MPADLLQPSRTIDPDDRLSALLAPDLAQPLGMKGVETAEDLYECMANLGPTWFRQFSGIDAARATRLVRWMDERGRGVGEVTERFYLPESSRKRTGPQKTPPVSARSEEEGGDFGIVPIERLALPPALSGADGVNRAPPFGCSLSARNDIEAIGAWLNARAGNPNTRMNYRKEAERFLLWCLREKGVALASVKADEASEYLRWLEEIGRTDPSRFKSHWKLPQAAWIGPKNTRREDPAWRPFNGPMSTTSRRNAVVIVRQLFNFLKKTGYLIFNPFDQVSAKVPFLKGEGVPQAFADRSLTDSQWELVTSHLALVPEGAARSRMRLILMMGKSLGMRASEMLDARAGWIVRRRIGFEERNAIEVVGKGSKVRRLPLNAEQLRIVDEALAARGLPGIGAAAPEEPLLVNLGRGPSPGGPMSRSGLYGVLKNFFERVAREISSERPMDASKLRASSLHWLRHTFAVTALQKMDVNIVQAAMGHASVATTGRYLAPEEETMSQAMEGMKAL